MPNPKPNTSTSGTTAHNTDSTQKRHGHTARPGRGNEIEILIIDQNALDVILAQDQGKLQKELVRLLEQERQAIKKQANARLDLLEKDKLDREDLDKLTQVEQLQQQIRERIGKTKDEGLRAEAQRLRQTLKDNKQPRSATQERLDDLAKELDRLANEELDEIVQ